MSKQNHTQLITKTYQTPHTAAIYFLGWFNILGIDLFIDLGVDTDNLLIGVEEVFKGVLADKVLAEGTDRVLAFCKLDTILGFLIFLVGEAILAAGLMPSFTFLAGEALMPSRASL